jgi:hypothetical protein
MFQPIHLMRLRRLLHLDLPTRRCFPRRHRRQGIFVRLVAARGALKRRRLRERSGTRVDGRGLRGILVRDALVVGRRGHGIEVLCAAGVGAAAAETAAD